MFRGFSSLLRLAVAMSSLVSGIAQAVDIIDKGAPPQPDPIARPTPMPKIERSGGGQASAANRTSATPKVAQRWGLLIGVDDYSNARDLEYCGADQRALYKSLLASGFSEEQLFLLHDDAAENRYRPSQRNIQKQLDLVLSLASEGDLIVLSFSGHGVSLDGKSYLCPNDMEIDDPATLLSLDTIYDRLRDCQATFKLVVIDACRNDPRPGNTRSAAATEDSKRVAQQLLDAKVPEGVVLLNSCAPGELSREDPDFGHGVFMNFILEGLKGPADKDGDGAISLYELQSYAVLKTKTHVARRFNSTQRPFYKIEGDATAMDYALLNVAAGAAASPPSTASRTKPDAAPILNIGVSKDWNDRTTSTPSPPPTGVPPIGETSSSSGVRRDAGWMGELFLYYDYSLRTVVYGVIPGSPAHNAGLRAGDRIVSVGGQKITKVGAVGDAIAATVPGNALMLRVERSGEKKDLIVLMGNNPADRGLARYRDAADGGETWAMVKIAFMLGTEGRHAESLEWFRRAADAGDIVAQHNLAGIYELGRHGVTPDPAEAFRWCSKAYANPAGEIFPDMKASVLVTLGDFHARGYGTAKDEAAALRYLEAAADLGSLDAMRRLAIFLMIPQATHRDPTRGIAYVRKSAEAGYPPAQFTIGHFYYSGDFEPFGVKKDPILAAEWMHKSAAGGYSSAMKFLSGLYKTGNGIPADLDKAEYWQRRFEAATGKK